MPHVAQKVLAITHRPSEASRDSRLSCFSNKQGTNKFKLEYSYEIGRPQKSSTTAKKDTDLYLATSLNPKL